MHKAVSFQSQKILCVITCSLYTDDEILTISVSKTQFNKQQSRQTKNSSLTTLYFQSSMEYRKQNNYPPQGNTLHDQIHKLLQVLEKNRMLLLYTSSSINNKIIVNALQTTHGKILWTPRDCPPYHHSNIKRFGIRTRQKFLQEIAVVPWNWRFDSKQTREVLVLY